jgi:hypothetical protein
VPEAFAKNHRTRAGNDEYIDVLLSKTCLGGGLMIVVTGATGNYGRSVMDGLSSKLPGSSLGVSVRDPEKATDLRDKGIRIEKANFAEPATLAAAFDGAEQVGAALRFLGHASSGCLGRHCESRPFAHSFARHCFRHCDRSCGASSAPRGFRLWRSAQSCSSRDDRT